MNKRNIMYISISIICVISIIIGVYYQMFEGKVIDEGAVNEMANVIEEAEADDPEDLLEEFNELFDNKFYTQGYSINTITKIAGLENKNVIYTAYDIKKEDEEKYSIDIKLPVFNVTGDIPARFNSRTQSIFADKASSILTIGTKYTIYNIDYVAYLNENILSLTIKATLKEGNSAQRTIVQCYNYDIETNKSVTLDEILGKEAAKQAEIISEATGQIVYKRDLNNAMYLTENVSNFFIGKDGQIYIIYAYGNNNITSEIDIIKL